MKIVSGDIGGTKARLALFDADGDHLRMIAAETHRSQEFPSLEHIVKKFLESHSASCASACFGIPGPVRGGRVETTNLPWVVDAKSLSRELGIEPVTLLNDLEASAHGIMALEPEDVLVVHQGRPEVGGNAALISAGTGLGEAGLFWDGRQHRPFSSEGGHSDFAPHSDLEIALLRNLRERFGAHVSWERVLSGPGLVNIYTFLRTYRKAEEPSWLQEEMREGDPAAAISKAALAGRSEVCSEALDLFVSFYGAEAGNLCLKIMATGGVYLGGGIAPKIAERLKTPTFMAAFRAKGRMAPALEAVPVRVVLNTQLGLIGPARYARMAHRESR